MAGGGNQEENPVAINVVAMVDIIFCLCLFFMCSLKFRPLDAKFESFLPKDKGSASSPNMNMVLDEIRVVLSWDVANNRLQRLFGLQAISNDEDGDKKLKGLIEESYRSYKAQGNPDVAVILDVGQAVPWTHAVKILDLAKDAGAPKVEFAMGTAAKQ